MHLMLRYVWRVYELNVFEIYVWFSKSMRNAQFGICNLHFDLLICSQIIMINDSYSKIHGVHFNSQKI